ncbi:MAG: hypothetical protein IIZ47_01170, partial [Erysipelotrichaceae bacterium]|nr:hypothetical protein [Erysipelotrichaceae bacterium]
NIVSTIDVNIQEIIRHALENYNEEMATDSGKTNGAKDVGVVIMDPKSGEVLGMDSSRWFDLNDPRNLSAFYSKETIAKMDNDAMMDALNGIWSNFCVSSAYEPGSVFKPVSAAAALETGGITDKDVFYCDGGEQVEDKYIQCDIYPGSHGEQSLQEAIMHSCNDSLMQIVSVMGGTNFLKYQEIFGYGLRTGIDLPGENSGQVFAYNDTGPVELATSSFGQGFTCTMIQETAAIASVINGGYYYKPHVVAEITDQNGSVIQKVEPILERRTVSGAISDEIREAMGKVMSMEGTGYLAKIPGYSMGGKTGTAEKLPRGEGNYVLSFVGFAPLDDPQVIVYVTVDEPNTTRQETTIYAMSIARNIFSELLPYMHIYPDEKGYDSTNVYATMITNRDLLGRKYQATENGVIVEGSGEQSWATAREQENAAEATEEGAAVPEETIDPGGDDDSEGVTEEEWNDPMSGLDISGDDEAYYQDGTPGTALDGSDLPSLAGEENEETVEPNNYFSDGMTNEDASWIGE